MTAGEPLKQAISERRALLVPGAANALTARIIEDLGFEAIYLTGAGLANTELGVPDIGLVTLTDLARASGWKPQSLARRAMPRPAPTRLSWKRPRAGRSSRRSLGGLPHRRSPIWSSAERRHSSRATTSRPWASASRFMPMRRSRPRS